MKSVTFTLFLVLSALFGTPPINAPVNAPTGEPTSASTGLSVTTQPGSSTSGAEGLVEDSEQTTQLPESTKDLYNSLIEHPAEPVVETAPGVQPDHPMIIELVEESQAELDTGPATQQSDSQPAPTTESPVPPPGTAAAGGGISVVFNSSSPAPSSVQTVLRAAVSQWDEALATMPGGPVEIEFFWSSLGSTSLLGYAGPDGMFSGEPLPTTDRYPAALVNSILGIDANGPARPEVQVVLNSDLADSGRWYIGTSGSPASGQLDLFSVALHELGHGLGFLGSAEETKGGDVELAATPFTFDQHAHHHDDPLPSFSSPLEALTSGDLHIDISAVETFELYAPSTWRQGSSYSHFDEGLHPEGQPGSLMTPTLRNTEVARTLDAPTLGVMEQVGWEIVPRAVTPTIGSTSVTTSSATLNWSRNFDDAGLPPTSYKVQAYKNGTTLVKTVSVSGTATKATVTGLAADTNYTMRITPVGANGNGTAASKTLRSDEEATTQPPVDTAKVRYLALDGQISRLYQAYFLRAPDQSGFNYWLQQRAERTALEDISNAFSSSQEFVNRYGSLSDTQFVNLVYQNVLDRQPDSEGRNYWLQILANGASRGSVMIGFAESPEFVQKTATAEPHSATEGSIRRLYQAFFLRNPDASGLAYWIGQANSGRSLADIATEFTASPEFVNRYGSLSNQAFVQLIYANVLDRAPDSGGLNFWINQLSSGQSRGAVMVGFSESSEFILKTGTLPN